MGGWGLEEVSTENSGGRRSQMSKRGIEGGGGNEGEGARRKEEGRKEGGNGLMKEV